MSNSPAKYKLLGIKEVLPQYKDLFVALFKIDDQEVVQRVLEAISGSKTSDICKCVNKEFEEKGTQTVIEDFEMVQNSTPNNPSSPTKPEDKKKRKRKLRGPRAEKSSGETKKVLIQNDRSIKERYEKIESSFLSGEENKHRNVNNENDLVENMPALDPLLSNIMNLGDYFIEEMCLPSKPQEKLISTMKEEYNSCLTYLEEVGLLPIHEAIRSNDLKKVKRQLYIFKFIGIDLKDILVRNEETNLLQFAIIHCCKKNIFEELMKCCSALIHEIDEDENNLIYLAVDCLYENSADIELFKNLLDSFFPDISTLKYLENTNCEGQTIFHFCVNKDKPIFCHLLFEKINSILKVKFVKVENGNLSKEKLLLYYNAKMNESLENLECLPDIRLKKSKIINIRDLKHGLSPLNQAVQNKNEIFVKIFLCNFADIDLKSYSGLSPLDQCENDSKIYNILVDYSKLLKSNIQN